MNVAGCIKYYRGQKGWTQADLHRATGYERAYISRLESGRINDLGLKTAMVLCRAFGISVEEFYKTCEKVGGASPVRRHHAGGIA